MDFVRPGEAFHFATTESVTGDHPHLHTHDFHEIFWIPRGEGIHHINEEERPLRAGTLVFVLATDHHGFSAQGSRPLRICNLAFSVSRWNTLRKRYWKAQDDPLRACPAPQREFQFAAEQISRLTDLTRELSAGADRSVLTLDRVLLDVMHQVQAVAPSAQGLLPDWLAAACRGIAAREWFSRGVEGFVELAGRSPEHVARSVRRYLNRVPTDVVNEARLTWAAARLQESDQPILDILYDCGLENLSHFYRLFHARFGVTPKRYRTAHHGIIRARSDDLHWPFAPSPPLLACPQAND